MDFRGHRMMSSAWTGLTSMPSRSWTSREKTARAANGRGAEPLYRHDVLLPLRSCPLLPLPVPGQCLKRIRPQLHGGKGGQHHRPAGRVQDHPRHVVGQHGVAAPDERPEQRRLADLRTAREQHRPRLGLDGAGVKRHHPALLQQRGEHRAGEKDAQVVVVFAAGLDENVPAVRDQIPGHAVHGQQEGAGGDLPERLLYDGRGKCGGRRADANRHVRFAGPVDRKGEKGQGDGRAHGQSVGCVVSRRAACGGHPRLIDGWPGHSPASAAPCAGASAPGRPGRRRTSAGTRPPPAGARACRSPRAPIAAWRPAPTV